MKRGGKQTSPENAASHRVELEGEDWALWRWVGVRGAGFPVEGALRLAAPECAEAADDLAAAEERARQLCEAALEAARRGTAGVPWSDLSRWQKAIRRLARGEVPAAPPEPLAPPVRAFAAASAASQAVRERYLQSHAAAERRLHEILLEAARGETFREAVLWQNRHALKTGVDPFLDDRSAAAHAVLSGRQRKRAILIASYLQRYCTKNETIAFFGPVGWARIQDDAAALTVRCGPRLVAGRKVFFEQWCVDTLASAFAARLPREWTAPRRLPFFHLSGDLCHPVGREPFRLPRQHLAALLACDGERLAVEIAADPRLGFASHEEACRVLEELEARGLIVWTLEVAKAQDAERELRRRLERVGDDSPRQRALQDLGELEAVRDDLARIQGDSAGLDRALGELEERFSRVTGRAPTRHQGRTYGSRTLVYQDCRRDIEIEMGPELLQRLGPPLALLLTSARWLTHEVGRKLRQRYHEVYRELRERNGTAEVEMAVFFKKTGRILESSSLIPECVADLQERWMRVLDVPFERRQVRYSAAELRPRVLAAFDAPGPGWRCARQHSPDVLIRAESAEAVRRGDYELVWGECHLSTNSLRRPLFIEQHPCGEELAAAMACDFPDPSVVPFLPKTKVEEERGPSEDRSMRWTSPRLDLGLVKPEDYRLAYTADPPQDPAARRLEVGELVVVEEDGGLKVRTRDRSRCFDILDVVDAAMTRDVANQLKLLPPRPHTPRLNVDHLVVQREAWQVELREARFVAAPSEAERFLAARRWAQSHVMPRFVFVKVPEEPKPFFVDFASPVSVAILARSVRQALRSAPEDAALAVSEMLPEPERQWLPDAAGRRYTSELRLIAVDLRRIVVDPRRPS